MTDSSVSPIRVFLVDDHPILLKPLAAEIDAASGIEVVGTATDAATALPLIEQLDPDIVLLDIELGDRTSFLLADQIPTLLTKNIRIIFLSAKLSDGLIDQALQVGAAGYLLKSEPVDVLIECIHQVAAGMTCFSKEIEERIDFADAGKPEVITRRRIATLTPTQFEVLRQFALGKTAKEVAEEMGLAKKTVDSHKYKVNHKLQIHSQVELARFAIREGISGTDVR